MWTTAATGSADGQRSYGSRWYDVDGRRLMPSELPSHLAQLAQQSMQSVTGESRWRVRIHGSSADARARRVGEMAVEAGLPNIYFQP